MSERDDWYRPPVETTTEDAGDHARCRRRPAGGVAACAAARARRLGPRALEHGRLVRRPCRRRGGARRGVPPSARQGHRQASSPRPPRRGLGRHDRRRHRDRARDQGLCREPVPDPVLVHGADAPLRPPGHRLRGALLGPRAREPVHLPLPRPVSRRHRRVQDDARGGAEVQRGRDVREADHRLAGRDGAHPAQQRARVRLHQRPQARRAVRPAEPARLRAGEDVQGAARGSTSSWATTARRRATRDSGEGCHAGTSSARCSRPTGLPSGSRSASILRPIDHRRPAPSS